jgi:cation diffusion facilitator family transporter
MASESHKTVYVALAANAGIAVAKGVGGALSGSSAMLAEAAHSVADTSNQGLLLASIRLSSRGPDEEHPFGHGKERFFWSFLAAVIVFLAGAVFAIGEGVRELLEASSEGSFAIVYGTLAFSLAAETVSFVRAVRQTRGEAREAGKGWLEHVRESTEPTSKMVVAEDAVAVAGVLVAFVGVGLHQLTGSSVWDAAAAITVGSLLVYVAYTLGRNFRELLIGAGAQPEDARRIREVLESHEDVEEVVDLKTMYMGPRSLLVAARVDLADGARDAGGVERLANELDGRLQEEVADVDQVFLDPTPRSGRSDGG